MKIFFVLVWGGLGFDAGICSVLLSRWRLDVSIKMPVFWTDAAVVSAIYGVNSECELPVSLNYGSGGYNPGVSDIDAARQKAVALNVACDLAEELKTWDWKPFTSYSKDIAHAINERIKALEAK